MHRAALIALCLSGCTLLDAGIDIPEACVTFHDEEVPGMPGGTSWTKTFVSDDLKIVDGFVKVDAVITDARARLTLRSGAPDFTFLDDVTVTVKDSTGALPPATIVACEHGACMSMSQVTEIVATVPDNVVDYARHGAPRFTVTLAGNLPAQAWRTDVEVCISGRASVKISP
ncbi:MAG TPA: hypothetical protein VKH36_06235 [Acidimicrobiia bacterium]|nr:hypothetical protein [Haliangiales bacterium]HMG26399.1 hypothetical protein [Acidimicrobiia bacterium]